MSEAALLYFLSHIERFTVDLLLFLHSAFTPVRRLPIKVAFCKEQAGSKTMSSLEATLYILKRGALSNGWRLFSSFLLEDTFTHGRVDGK